METRLFVSRYAVNLNYRSMYRKALCPILAPKSGLVAGRWAHTSEIREGFGLTAIAGWGSDAVRFDNSAQGGTIAGP